jgi:hypothetical protein
MNQDRKVDINDVTFVQKILVQLIKAPENFEEVADVNKDGKVNIRDATYIQLYLLSN